MQAWTVFDRTHIQIGEMPRRAPALAVIAIGLLLLYGVGFVRVQHIRGDIEVSTVHRDEYLATADQLQWLDEHGQEERKQ